MRRVVLALVVSVLASTTLLALPATAKTPKAIREATVDCSAATSCTIAWKPASPLDVYVGTDPDDIATSAPPAASGTGSATVTGLDPSQRSYFELVPKGARRGIVVADRSLHLESAPNARDIGGYETKDGHHVQWGTVFRSDALSDTTAGDEAKIANLGIKIVCDFRGDSEVAADGPDKLPAGPESIRFPVLDEQSDQLAGQIRDAVTSGDRAAQQELLGDGKAEQLLVDGGAFFVTNATATEQFGALVQRLADPASLPALTHCTAGKDRTGWSSAVILTALGAPQKTVMADYLLTNDYVKEKNDKTLAAIAALNGLPELVRPVLEVRAEYLNASFDAVKKEYGSFAKYLRKGLGVDAATLAQLKKNLLTE